MKTSNWYLVVRSEIFSQRLSLLRINDDAVVTVVAHVAYQAGLLGQGQQSTLHCRYLTRINVEIFTLATIKICSTYSDNLGSVQVNDTLDVRPGLVNGRVKHEARLVHAKVCCSFFYLFSLKYVSMCGFWADFRHWLYTCMFTLIKLEAVTSLYIIPKGFNRKCSVSWLTLAW